MSTIIVNGIGVEPDVMTAAMVAIRSQADRHEFRAAERARTEGTRLSERRKAKALDEVLALLSYATGIDAPRSRFRRPHAKPTH